jgi:hypothetical protein
MSSTLPTRLKALLKMSEPLRIEGHDWPFKRFGMMILDQHSEDGEWDAVATSENARGANLAWENPINLALIRDGEVIVPESVYAKLIACVEAFVHVRSLHKDWINGARADVVYERMEEQFKALTALELECARMEEETNV